MAPRPDEYVSLDLTLIGCIETSTVYTSKVMRYIGDDTNAYDVSDKAVGIKAKVEVDIGG